MSTTPDRTIYNNFKSNILPLLQSAPEHVIGAGLVRDIVQWSDPPKAIEVLYTRDLIERFSLAPGMIMVTIFAVYGEALKAEGTTKEEVESRAKVLWRDKDKFERPNFSLETL